MKLRRSILVSFFIGILTISLSPVRALENQETALKPSAKAGYHIYAHSHNDYEHERPLLDALDNRCYSVEADIWLVDGEILVSHNEGKYKGGLKELYLDPLQKLVDQKGFVFGDGETVYLWLDIKDARPELRPVLHELLNRYSMFTVYTDKEIKAGPVTAILTGDAESKTRFVEQFPVRKFCRDSNDYKSGDPKADNRWTWYAPNWRNYIQWNGVGEIAPEQYAKLVEMVNDVHAKGRKIRFWSVPDKPSFWKLALETGIDLINTDNLTDLNRFLEQQ
ncbi:MAG: hypothetical protein AB1656_24110 [Candidatus Omnitrophota bacterium]